MDKGSRQWDKHGVSGQLSGHCVTAALLVSQWTADLSVEGGRWPSSQLIPRDSVLCLFCAVFLLTSLPLAR